MTGNLKDSLEGAGIGLLGGLVIGIVDADWIRLAIALALIAYAGSGVPGKTPVTIGRSVKTIYMGLASFLAVLVGLYINGNQVFNETPKEAVGKYMKAGYSPEQARILFLREIIKENDSNDTDSSGSGVLK